MHDQAVRHERQQGIQKQPFTLLVVCGKAIPRGNVVLQLDVRRHRFLPLPEHRSQHPSFFRRQRVPCTGRRRLPARARGGSLNGLDRAQASDSDVLLDVSCAEAPVARRNLCRLQPVLLEQLSSFHRRCGRDNPLFGRSRRLRHGVVWRGAQP